MMEQQAGASPSVAVWEDALDLEEEDGITVQSERNSSSWTLVDAVARVGAHEATGVQTLTLNYKHKLRDHRGRCDRAFRKVKTQLENIRLSVLVFWLCLFLSRRKDSNASGSCALTELIFK